MASPAEGPADETTSWLLDGDPAIRWQTKVDLLDLPGDDDRAAIATEGWGAELLAHQDPSGTWGGGLYSPKWVSTTYTLLLLRRMGLAPGHPAAIEGCQRLFDGFTWIPDGGLSPSPGASQPAMCVTGMLVMLGAYFGHEDRRLDDAVAWLTGTAQLADGGWNCQSPRSGSKHGSFHTSITVLEALRDYTDAGGSHEVEAKVASERGRSFFLDHQLHCSHRTGEPVHENFTRFSFPPRWYFDVLRGLDYFQAVGAGRDERLEMAVDLVRHRRRSDGTWSIQNRHPGRTFFEMEKGARSQPLEHAASPASTALVGTTIGASSPAPARSSRGVKGFWLTSRTSPALSSNP